MAHTFPMPADKFIDLMKIADAVFTPARNDQVSGLGNGQPLNAEMASPLWKVDITTIAMSNDDAEAIAALVEVLERPGNDFYVYNPRKRWPRADKDGKIISGGMYLHTSLAWNDNLIWLNAMPWGGPYPSLEGKIASIASNNHQVSLSDLAPGYVISRGDMFAFEYGSVGQKRRALHRFGETVTATESGLTGQIEVYPHIRTGAGPGTSITLLYPSMRAKIIPGTYRISGSGPLHQTISFSAIQKLI